MKADLILHNIGTLLTLRGENAPRKGTQMSEAEVLKNAYLAVKDGKILCMGEGQVPKELLDDNTVVTDIEGKTVTPGLVDPHTHLVHGGSRENEFSLKLQGVPYLEILKQGGGILSTVNATKSATEDMLFEKAKKSLDTMLLYGTTTVEAKSGYGLDWETERKQMIVAKSLNEKHPVEVVSTFMGAHAVPKEYKEDSDKFVDILINEMIPKVEAENLAEFCDVFCEEGVFSVDQTRRILEAGKKHGLKPKMHADEIIPLGGAELAAEIGAISADHLMAASEEGMDMMAKAGVIANILPGTTFSLMAGTYAKARLMMEKGVAVSLSTDYNPGSCPSENMQFVMQLGCLALKMTPIEVFTAVTINSAYAIDRGDKVGSFNEGKEADIVVFDAPNLEYILYHFGINHVSKVYKSGKLVVDKNNVVY